MSRRLAFPTPPRKPAVVRKSARVIRERVDQWVVVVEEVGAPLPARYVAGRCRTEQEADALALDTVAVIAAGAADAPLWAKERAAAVTGDLCDPYHLPD